MATSTLPIKGVNINLEKCPLAENRYCRNILAWAKKEAIVVRTGQYPRHAASGVTNWWCLEAKQPKASVLIVHGTGDDAFFPFAALLRDLIKRDLSIFLFDLDGHGMSSTTLFDEQTIQSSVEAAWALLTDELPKHIIGFSLGATLALNAAKQGAIAPSSLVLIAPAVRLDLETARILPEIRGLASKVFWQHDDGGSIMARLPAFGPVGRSQHPVRLRRTGLASGNYMIRAQQTIAACNLAALRQFQLPTLVIYGGSDLIVPALSEERWKAMAPHSELRIIAGAFHFVLPYHPDCLRAVKAWFEN